ncbi:hypothetical protein [Catenuloplanes indicus]|uniref:Uncharacterized protein n=1 Tax=Catenuloplanes indicus TaxID=137267 RepID=A0AAE3VX95_9ACTN|nr:hypothetical protein [Catenuloplanes indicus]MDQ0364720.1 hypothetical protein [Catenuloplanes indicus]
MAPRIDLTEPSPAARRAAVKALTADLAGLRRANALGLSVGRQSVDLRDSLSRWEEGLREPQASWWSRVVRRLANVVRSRAGQTPAGTGEPATPDEQDLADAIRHILADPRLAGLRELYYASPGWFARTRALTAPDRPAGREPAGREPASQYLPADRYAAIDEWRRQVPHAASVTSVATDNAPRRSAEPAESVASRTRFAAPADEHRPARTL